MKFDVDQILICHNTDNDCDPVPVIYRGPFDSESAVVYDKISGAQFVVKLVHLRPMKREDKELRKQMFLKR